MLIELYRDANHLCQVIAGRAVRGEIPTNPGLVVHGCHAALIDPGGTVSFTRVRTQLNTHLRYLDYFIASHLDPDCIGALEQWLLENPRCKVVVPALWRPFLPHLCAPGLLEGRCECIPEEGGILPLGDAELRALPAHFLHAQSTLHYHDPVARTLFTGDMGGALGDEVDAAVPVESLAPHLPALEAFHRRHMAGNKVCRLWVNMVRPLDLEWLVPHHGPPLHGRETINQFLDWLETLECGVDLLSEEDYRVPVAH